MNPVCIPRKDATLVSTKKIIIKDQYGTSQIVPGQTVTMCNAFNVTDPRGWFALRIREEDREISFGIHCTIRTTVVVPVSEFEGNFFVLDNNEEVPEYLAKNVTEFKKLYDNKRWDDLL